MITATSHVNKKKEENREGITSAEGKTKQLRGS